MLVYREWIKIVFHANEFHIKGKEFYFSINYVNIYVLLGYYAKNSEANDHLIISKTLLSLKLKNFV
jgi:hypothetical protein